MLSELRTDYTLTIAEFRAATALRVGAQRGTRPSEPAVACCGALAEAAGGAARSGGG